MNNNITEDYCSFEVSKLLKWKNFAVPCSRAFCEPDRREIPDDKPQNMNGFRKFISRPTHALAIKWIRENFQIDVTICIVAGDSYGMWIFKNRQRQNKEGQGNFMSYEEATEAALKYTLENLI